MRKAAIEKNPGSTILDGVATKLPFPDGTFDLVICIEVLRYLHSADNRQALREMYRVLKAKRHHVFDHGQQVRARWVLPELSRPKALEAGSVSAAMRLIANLRRPPKSTRRFWRQAFPRLCIAVCCSGRCAYYTNSARASLGESLRCLNLSTTQFAQFAARGHLRAI